MGIYERIREISKKQNLSINRLEQELSLPRSSISKYNKNKPSFDKIQRIADKLGVSVDYILSGEDNRFSEENAHLVAQVRRDPELTEALKKYFDMSSKTKKHVIELINMLSEE